MYVKSALKPRARLFLRTHTVVRFYQRCHSNTLLCSRAPMNTVTGGTLVKPVLSFQKLLDSFLDLLLPRKRHSRCFSYRFYYPSSSLYTAEVHHTLEKRRLSLFVFSLILFNFSEYTTR